MGDQIKIYISVFEKNKTEPIQPRLSHIAVSISHFPRDSDTSS